MPLDTDAVLDRRLLRRKVTFWRVVAVVFGIIGLGVAGYVAGQATGAFGITPHVARIEVKGVITQNADLIRAIDQLRDNPAVRGVVINIDSPGGTVTGAEALYSAIRRVAERKPTVALVDGMAASGGYIAAIATDHIITRETSMTGSIGVIVQFPNVARLLETWGVRVEAIRSTPLKAQPSGLEPTSPEAAAALREVVLDSYAWFQRLVKERRNLTDEELRVAADGRVFSGNRARAIKLTDAIGGLGEARDWLATKGVPRNTPVRLHRPRSGSNVPFVAQAGAFAAEAVGLSAIAERLRTSTIVAGVERSTLDGLLAVWQPPTP